MSKFDRDSYNFICKQIWDELQAEVAQGELSKADAHFIYRMRIDDVLWGMGDDDEEEENRDGDN